MAGPNPAEVIVGANGVVRVADTDATAPSSASEDLSGSGSDWTDLGYVTEDGATFTDSRELTDINSWQTFYPVRKIATARTSTIAFGLRQWNEDTLPFALGGGTLSMGVFTPPTAGEQSEKSLVVDWEDLDLVFRLYIARGIVSSSVSFTLSRNENAVLPIEFSVLGTQEGDQDTPYLLFMEAAGSGS